MISIFRIVISFSLLMLISCGGSGSEKETTTEDVRDDMRELMQTTGDYMSESFAAIVEDFNKVKKDADAKIGAANAAYDELTAEARAEYTKHISNLEAQVKEFDDKVEQYKDATADERKRIEEEVKTLKSALEKSVKAFEEEMKKHE